MQKRGEGLRESLLGGALNVGQLPCPPEQFVNHHRPRLALDLQPGHGPHLDFRVTSLSMADSAYEALLENGFHIQPFPVWADDFAHPERQPNPELFKNIANEGVRL